MDNNSMDNSLTREASNMPLDRSPASMAGAAQLLDAIRQYWNTHIHDLEIAKHPVGTKEFFEDLREYRFDKLRYLPEVADFAAYKGKRLLEVGCGVGLDLMEFARRGSQVTGVDLAECAIELATKNFTYQGVYGDLRVMNGERLEFEDNSFDAVYAHGVLQYTADPRRMLAEIHRVLRPGGDALLMVYNRYSWLNLLSVLVGVTLEHEDAPVLNKYSARQFADMLQRFSAVHMSFERFPVKTRLHGGLKGVFFNTLFVPLFNVIPTPMIRRSGWHLLAKVKK
jgi:ubiquinone/menaquinone biosynthesis C-methylase UbiE